MITLEQIARYLENGLNAELGEKNIKFHIWANVGKKDKSFRSGNRVTHYITGNLLSPASSNDANLLVMGVNTLSLEFAIPVKRPRTYANQPQAELQEIVDGQYPFVNQVYGAIDRYFQKAQSFILLDGKEEYSLSMQAGTSLSGSVDISSELGRYVTAYVSITLYFIQGGTISKDITVTFDNSPIPYQVVRVGRSSEMSRDVYSGNYTTKALCSSTAFSIDVQFPSNADDITASTVGFILKGVPNESHFVTVQWGKNAQKKVYMMTLDNSIANAQGVTIAGITAAFVEASQNAELLNFPTGYQVVKFFFRDSFDKTLEFDSSLDCNGYIGGRTISVTSQMSIPLVQGDFSYDEEENGYFVTLVTDQQTIVGSENPFKINGVWYYSVKDNWRFKDKIESGINVSANVSFRSGGNIFAGLFTQAGTGSAIRMMYVPQGSSPITVYSLNESGSGGFTENGKYQSINFGNYLQGVSQSFYEFLIANAVKAV